MIFFYFFYFLLSKFESGITRERFGIRRRLRALQQQQQSDSELLTVTHSARPSTPTFSTPSVFFSNFYFHCLRSNDGVNFGENPIWGNFHNSTRSPLLLFSSLDDDICLKWSGIGLSGSWNPQFCEKRLGEMSLPQLQFTPIFEIFKLIFQFF